MQVISVSPFRCRMWPLHDRIEGHVTEENCRSEIDSFSKHGQLVPALGRVLRGDPDYDIELIYGARRLFVARHINKPLAVEVRELSDREAIVAMDIENRQRMDVTPYERGISYAHWLRAGHFQSQDEIARALKVSPSQVSRLLKLARLPSVVVGAFASPTEICEGWGLDLVEVLEDPQRRPTIVQKARSIGSAARRPSARAIYQQLMAAAAPGKKLKVQRHDEVVKDKNGAPLFRIRRQTNSIALLLPVEKLSPESLASIQQAIAAILQASDAGVADPKHLPRTGIVKKGSRAQRRFVGPEPVAGL
jgi:ParB family chromosome partitioning protein